MQWKSGVAIAAVSLFAAVSSANAAETINVTIKGMKFTPAEVTAHLGDTILWTNEDAMPHTATARSKDWDLQVPPGKTASLIVEKAGVFEYFCRFHPRMTAKLTAE
jgi:plastocyanin